MITETAEQTENDLAIQGLERATKWLSEHRELLSWGTSIFLSPRPGQHTQITLGLGVSDAVHREICLLLTGHQATKQIDGNDTRYAVEAPELGLSFRWNQWDPRASRDEEVIAI